MLFIILGIVIGLIVIIWLAINENLDWGFLGGITVCLVFIMVWLITSLCINTNVKDDKLEYETIESTEIYCLVDNRNVEGNYFLFSGSVDEELYYYYVHNNSLGRVTDKIPASSSYINYVSQDFRVETVKAKHKNRFIGYWLGADWVCIEKYKIYVPEGSITCEGDYNIDLK